MAHLKNTNHSYLIYPWSVGEALRCNRCINRGCSNRVETCSGPNDVCASVIFLPPARKYTRPSIRPDTCCSLADRSSSSGEVMSRCLITHSLPLCSCYLCFKMWVLCVFDCRVLFVILLKMVVDGVIVIGFFSSYQPSISSDVAWRRPTATCWVLCPALWRPDAVGQTSATKAELGSEVIKVTSLPGLFPFWNGPFPFLYHL